MIAYTEYKCPTCGRYTIVYNPVVGQHGICQHCGKAYVITNKQHRTYAIKLKEGTQK